MLFLFSNEVIRASRAGVWLAKHGLHSPAQPLAGLCSSAVDPTDLSSFMLEFAQLQPMSRLGSAQDERRNGAAGGGARRRGPPAQVASLQGTSMATPLAAGSAALVRQYFLDGFYPSRGGSGPTRPFIRPGVLVKGCLAGCGVLLTPHPSCDGASLCEGTFLVTVSG